MAFFLCVPCRLFGFLDFVCFLPFGFLVLVCDFACHSTARAFKHPPLSFIPPMTMIDRKALQAHAFATKPQGVGRDKWD